MIWKGYNDKLSLRAFNARRGHIFILFLVLLTTGALVGCVGDRRIGTPTAFAEVFKTDPTDVRGKVGVNEDTPTAYELGLRVASPQYPSPTPTAPSKNLTQIGTSVIPTPSPTPVITDSPLEEGPDRKQEAPITINSPGEGSRVLSPIRVVINLSNRETGTLHIELRGVDGRLIARQVKALEGASTSGPLVIDLKFEIATSFEEGRLLISQKDEHGRLVDLNSVDLTLLSEGGSRLIPPESISQMIVIQQPISGETVTGGMLAVTGITRLRPYQPLRVELITEYGKVVGHRLAGFGSNSLVGYSTFAAEVPYSISQTTLIRLIVFQDGDLISDKRHLSSIEIILNP